jgi:iron-sulfur cluster repair protein YtfE (RIC family)
VKSTAKRSGAKSGGGASAKKTPARGGQNKGVLAKLAEKVTNLFAGPANDALNLLKADHDRVAAMFETVKANEDGNHAATFRRIKEELDLHAHVEEQIFYPHLLENGDTELKKMVREGLEEHGQVKKFLSELSALRGDSPTFRAKLKVLIEDVEHHVDEEEGEMFPLVKDQIDEEMRVRLGSLIEAEKKRSGKAMKSSA